MAVTLITGDDGGTIVNGTPGDDLIYGYDPNGPQSVTSSITATRVANGLSQPLFAGAPPGELSRLFIVEKTGQIKILDLASGQILPVPFLDVSAEITTDGESGLLGLAFDPNYATNGRFYVNLIRPGFDTEIRSYTVSASDPNRADAASATLVIGIDQPPFSNHKAGWLGFGRDGYLYAALGDGGSPSSNGQNIDVLLGKILRLDVNSDAFPGDPTRNYAIPADNPFVGPTAGLDEIWALGLRNPFRDSFDRALGTLFVADVGQSTWEEISIAQGAGSNFGWDRFEGPDPFNPGPLSAGFYVPPIFSYDHSVGSAIIGGYVYRGPAEALHGDYFYADLNGRMFSLHFNGSSWVSTERTGQISASAGAISTPSSFGEDGLGNLYVTDLDGEVFRLTPNVISADQGDTVSGGNGNDMMFGGSGEDILLGGFGNDTLYGGNGADLVRGDEGNDLLFGDAGDDRVRGGDGRDTLVGGIGDDRLFGDSGDDLVFGGAGDDTAGFSGTRADYRIVALANGVLEVTDLGLGSPDGTDRLHEVEHLAFADGTIVFAPSNDAPHDFDGDRASDIFWRTDNGGLAAWQMNGTQIEGADFFRSGSAIVGAPGPDWHIIAPGALPADFDGDDRGDVLWQTDDGSLAMWFMNGTQIKGADYIRSGTAIVKTPGPDWHIVETGDFDGNGRADLFWRTDSGALAIWKMNGNQIMGADFLRSGTTMVGTPGPDWHVLGTDDFDGDGRGDLLWRTDDGTLAIWELDGTQIKAADYFRIGSTIIKTPGSDWHIVGTGDFDGDGRGDLLWRTDDGSLAIWEMDGTQIKAADFLKIGSTTIGAPGSDWHIDGTGDFDGNGTDDILWRTDSGALAVWTMNGFQISGADYLRIGSTQIGVPAADWSIVQHQFDLI
jgi:glucose/arabinose dehydrogenase